MLNEAVIVDVDGTLAQFDAEHVKSWVLGVEKDWLPFFEYMKDAAVIENVLKLVKILHKQGNKILICSGRPNEYRRYTIAWLEANNIPFDEVYLRAENTDHLPDEEIKSRLLIDMKNAGYVPWLVLDDRDCVVDFWRGAGLTCLQCAAGDF